MAARISDETRARVRAALAAGLTAAEAARQVGVNRRTATTERDLMKVAPAPAGPVVEPISACRLVL